jgi:hypothetical protein
MLKSFSAEILFLDPDKMSPALAALTAAGCTFTPKPELIDPCGPTVWFEVTGATKLDEGELGNWLLDIVGPHEGDAVEWGIDEEVAKRRQAAAERTSDNQASTSGE